MPGTSIAATIAAELVEHVGDLACHAMRERRLSREERGIERRSRLAAADAATRLRRGDGIRRHNPSPPRQSATPQEGQAGRGGDEHPSPRDPSSTMSLCHRAVGIATDVPDLKPRTFRIRATSDLANGAAAPLAEAFAPQREGSYFEAGAAVRRLPREFR